jgi:hypothetical protein
MENAAEEGVNQFGEEPKSKSSNKKVFIKVISVISAFLSIFFISSSNLD